MASRDRFGGFGEPAQTQLQRYIYNACDPSNYESNLALNLEVADLINSKKGNAPREGAITIVNLINHRNPNVSLHALSLLDICVKNCGYPFHLQISTKEFLNELVRRFPERPPSRSTRVQNRILEAIEEWRQTICQTSRYKEDLGFIRDMHRLLLYKGYIFPEVKMEDAAVLNPSDNLKSAEEMEEEEKAAQSAKLQELIRRGSPEDLQEANRLMKVMAGYDTRHKTDYRAKAAEEVAKVQQKAKILEEMLQGHRQGDAVGEGDVFEELANALQSAHPKIQKMCEEESDDAEAVAKLLEINDSIHRTVERYKLVKKGDVEGANKIPKGTLGTSTGVGKNAANELSLIDFDPEPPTNGQSEAEASSEVANKTTVEDDLLGLSMEDKPFGQTGNIALGFGANANVPGPALLSSTTEQSTARNVPANPTPQPQQSSQPNYNAFSSFAPSNPPSKPSTPAPTSLSQLQQKPQPPSSNLASDPFAALVSPSPRASTPSVPPPSASRSQANQPTSLVDLTSDAPPHNGTSVDDEWDFASSLPESNAPTSNRLPVHSSSVSIEFLAARKPTTPPSIHIVATFSNTTPKPISGLHFQLAIEKGYTLQLRPQSGREIAPMGKNAISQEVLLNNVEVGKGSSIKLRYKVSYRVGDESKEEQGSVPSLGIS
ncbi:MAG: hypothetical protein Q9227_005703 [Pyrenula ochraceoflavens]